MLTGTWDEIHDECLSFMHEDVRQRLMLNDPARGKWVDASSLSLGVVLEVGCHAVEDGTWLRHDDASHINMAELDASVKGIEAAFSLRALTRVDARRRVLGDMQITLFCFQKLIPIN